MQTTDARAAQIAYLQTVSPEAARAWASATGPQPEPSAPRRDIEIENVSPAILHRAAQYTSRVVQAEQLLREAALR